MFPNEKNRIWTMCQATLQMLVMTVEEAEKAKMTSEQFFLSFENVVNNISVKDHNDTSKGLDEFKNNLNDFNADSGIS